MSVVCEIKRKLAKGILVRIILKSQFRIIRNLLRLQPQGRLSHTLQSSGIQPVVGNHCGHDEIEYAEYCIPYDPLSFILQDRSPQLLP